MVALTLTWIICWAAAGVFLEVGGVGVEVKAFYVTMESPVLVRKRK